MNEASEYEPWCERLLRELGPGRYYLTSNTLPYYGKWVTSIKPTSEPDFTIEYGDNPYLWPNGDS